MAKHMVKCAICGENFDVNSIQAVKHGARRYAHQTCEPSNTELIPMEVPKKTQEEIELATLKDYINKMYGDKANWVLITKQIKAFKTAGKSYNGMLAALQFFYEVQHNTVDKSNGGIGIIEFVWDQAKQYYYQIWIAQQQTQNKTVVQKVKEVIFKPSNKRGTKNKLIDWSSEDEE